MEHGKEGEGEGDGTKGDGEQKADGKDDTDKEAYKPSMVAACQLKALMWKNCTSKRRNLKSTCCEICSPCLLVAVLVWGFTMSTVTFLPSENFSIVNRTIPGPVLLSVMGLSPSGSKSKNPGQYMDFLNGPLPVPTFDQYVGLSRIVAGATGDLADSPLLNSDEGQRYTNLIFLGSLQFAPDSPATRSLVSYLEATTTTFTNLTHRVHKDEEAALAYVNAHLHQERTWAVVVVNSAAPGDVDFTLRMNYSVVPSTYDVVNWLSHGLDTTYQKYYLSGFLTLQATVHDWVFNATVNTTAAAAAGQHHQACKPPRMLGVPFPTAPFSQNTFFTAVGYLLGLAMTMATLYPVSKLLKDIVEEKETRMKETMKIMGVRGWILSLSWLLTAIITFFIIAVDLTWLMGRSFIPRTAPSLLFAYLFLFFLSEVAFAFLLSTFFNRAKLAAIIGPVALFVTVLPRYVFFGTSNNEALLSKYAVSLLSPTAFTFGADILAAYEYAEIGVQWDNYNGGDGGGGAWSYSFGSCLRMLLFDASLYLLLAWYFEKVLPSEYGTHERPWFFLLPSYWCPRGSPPSAALPVRDADAPPDDGDGGVCEAPPDPAKHPVRVVIRDLVKRYSDGNMAVRKLNLSMYEGQVCCLLGHNGAGKTSTISLITGLFPPTSGDAFIWGRSLTRDLAAVRQDIGICPQVNVLFPDLTVREHLIFFSLLKGMPAAHQAKRVEDIVQEVGLTEKRHTYSKNLSGGMKRKLCIANALVASPRFILLDEPTSGMDPFSRRATWELIQRNKKGRVTLLTTHYLDEAELLGDRVAIMSGGRLRTSGTPLFLKNRFGTGYSLTIVVPRLQQRANSTALVAAVTRLIRSHVPDADLFSTAGAELLYRLPLACSPAFPALLKDLSDKGPGLGIADSFGISMTTLEQVFLKIAKDDDQKQRRGGLDKLPDVFPTPPTGAASVPPSLLDLSTTTMALSASAHSPIHNDNLPQSVTTTTATTSNTSGPTPMARTVPPHDDDDGDSDGAALEMTKREDDNMQRQQPQHTTTKDIVPTRQANGQDKHARFEHEDRRSSSSSNRSHEGDAAGGHRYLKTRLLWEQLRQLMWKRALVARRDLKGLGFQILLPAVLIALVLLILTIRPRMAGPSIGLNAALYSDYGPFETLYASPLNDTNKLSLVHQQGSNSHLNTYRYTPTGDSYNTSAYMLSTFNGHKDQARLGAYVFHDDLLLNITVDYPLIKRNLPVIEQTALAVAEVGLVDGLSSPAPGVIAYQGPVTVPFSTQDSSAKSLLSAATQLLSDSYNTTAATEAAATFLVAELLQALNLTDAEVTQAFNLTLPVNMSLASLLATELLLLSNTSSTSTSLSLKGALVVQRILYNTSSDQVTLQDTKLQSSIGSDIMLGNLTYSLGQLGHLPDRMVLYRLWVHPSYTVLHNASSSHAVAAFYEELTRLKYESCSGQAAKTFVARNHPLPLTEAETLNVQTILSLFTALFLLIPLTYIPAAFVVFVVRERAIKAKHLQFVSGVNRQIYWLATYLWDALQYAVLCGLIMGVFFLYGGGATRTFLLDADTTAATFLLLWCYGLAAIPQAYLYSWAFENAATAQISIMGLNFISGFVFVMAYYIMLSIPKTAALAVHAVKVFRLFPAYNIGDGLINVSTLYYKNYLFDADLWVFDWECTGRPLTYLIAEMIAFSALVLIVDSDLWERVVEGLGRLQDKLLLGKHAEGGGAAEEDEQDEVIDEDVAAERSKIMAGGADAASPSASAVLLKGLRKTYRQANGSLKRAVRVVTLSIPHSECFGFLGINGAGKTTTLSILTGDLRETSGECFVGGYPARSAEARRSIGYCPQVDPLIEWMTATETLLFYGSLKGLPKQTLKHTVRALIKKVGLSKFSEKPCGSYSGGNKRKLSLCIALIGDPPVILLDEPSCGMDPQARRSMWDVITDCCSNKQQSVILTTHSMEECEALCTRLTIMVGGRLRCLGSCQHLKGRFGNGYKVGQRAESHLMVEIKCTGSDELSMMRQALAQRFSSQAREEEAHGLHVRYSLSLQAPGSSSRHEDDDHDNDGDKLQRNDGGHRVEEDEDVDSSSGSNSGGQLADLFTILEEGKAQGNLQEYCVSQPTLEEIFLLFAKQQEEETGKIQGMAYHNSHKGGDRHSDGTNKNNNNGISANNKNKKPKHHLTVMPGKHEAAMT